MWDVRSHEARCSWWVRLTSGATLPKLSISRSPSPRCEHGRKDARLPRRGLSGAAHPDPEGAVGAGGGRSAHRPDRPLLRDEEHPGVGQQDGPQLRDPGSRRRPMGDRNREGSLMSAATQEAVADHARPNAAPGIGNDRARWRDHETYKALFVNPWTYITGAVVLAVLNIALLAVAGEG